MQEYYQQSTQPPLNAARVPVIAIIILNYNTAQAAIDLYWHITNLRNGLTLKPFYLVVDNASRPAEVSQLKSFFSDRADSQLILSEVNGGYAQGNNLGLRQASNLGVDYCLIANSDIAFLTKTFLEQFVEAASTLPNCGLIGPKVVFPNGMPQGPLHEMGMIRSLVSLPPKVLTAAQSVHATVGCCIFGSTKIFQAIDYFDESTFLYCEEVILAERLRPLGFCWYCLPMVLVQHNHVRKMDTVRKLLMHKQFEAQSGIYYFRHYKKRSSLFVLVYRMLLAAKVSVYIAYILGFRWKNRLSTILSA